MQIQTTVIRRQGCDHGGGGGDERTRGIKDLSVIARTKGVTNGV